MQAMIFAAGLGTRLQPLTTNKPKALVEINGKPLLERCIENLKNQGITNIVINVHHFSDQIINVLAKNNFFGVNIKISDESDHLLDTGGGILKARNLFTGSAPILLINVDILTDLSFNYLYQYHKQENSLATLVVRKRETSRYLLFAPNNQLVGWKNYQTGQTKISRPGDFENSTPYAFSGIQIIQPELINQITETGKFSVIDLYLRLAKTNTIKAFIDDQSVWMDLGKFNQLSEAEKLARQFDKQ